MFPTGVNVPDHDMTFQSLSELLQQSVSPFVASVQAKECGGEEADEKIKKMATNMNDFVADPLHSFNVPLRLDPISIFSALKHLMKKVLERLMGTAVALDDDDDDEEEEAEHSSAQRVHCSLGRLCDWYTSKTKVGL